MITRSIPVTTHGRYLVVPAAHPAGAPLLVSFHGYAEPADIALERAAGIPGSDRWCLVSIQGLHRFYRGRSMDVVASWMTRQNREPAIADNVAYVQQIVSAVRREWTLSGRVVYAGFSQGVAMAFRSAAAGPGAGSVIACGGDVPPELDAAALGRISSVLVGRGERDEWYTAAKLDADIERLRLSNVPAEAVRFDGGHEWSPAFAEAAGAFLRSCT